MVCGMYARQPLSPSLPTRQFRSLDYTVQPTPSAKWQPKAPESGYALDCQLYSGEAGDRGNHLRIGMFLTPPGNRYTHRFTRSRVSFALL